MVSLLLAGCLCSCRCGENKEYSVSTTLEDGAQRATIKITAKASSGFVRSGMLTSRRYLFNVSFKGADPTVASIYLKGETPLVEHAAMKQGLSKLAMRVAPDGKRFALELPPYAGRVLLFFVLPRGEPLHDKGLDEELAFEKLAALAWDRVPAPEAAALRVLRRGVGKQNKNDGFCMLDGPDNMLTNLEDVLAANMDRPVLADAVLAAWPSCRQTRELVVEYVKKGKPSRQWAERLKGKARAQLALQKLEPRALVTIVKTCRVLDDAALLEQAYAAAVKRWPDDYQMHYDVFRFNVPGLPAAIKKELLARARKTLTSDTELHRGYAKELLGEVDK